MIYYFWAKRSIQEALEENKYIEIACQTCDREVIKVDTDFKTFEVVHKHVPESFDGFAEDINFIINENYDNL